MNIRGRRTLDAPGSAVYAAIMDPNVLLDVIPGCREIEQTSATEYHGRISLRLPGVVGTYRTVVRVSDASPPDYGELEGEVTGTLGSIKGRATFRLTEADGSTTVEYEGRAAIDGPLARLDTRFVESLAGSLIDQGLGALETRLQQRQPDVPPATDPTAQRDPAKEEPA